MSPFVLTWEEIQANMHRRESAKRYIQLCLRTDNCKPSGTEMKAHLDLQDWPDVMKHGWVDEKIADTSYILNIEVSIYASGIVVGDPLEWWTLLVGQEKRICNSFDDYVIQIYECLFIRI